MEKELGNSMFCAADTVFDELPLPRWLKTWLTQRVEAHLEPEFLVIVVDGLFLEFHFKDGQGFGLPS